MMELDKNSKYDRQLRLWGDHGQTCLESARVCLIHATATGTEIIKNLVLPGVGSFTIVDKQVVRGQDIGNNFFLLRDSIGKKRGEVATKLLCELNADVTGDFIDADIEDLMNDDKFLSRFTCIILADIISDEIKLKLDSCLASLGVPLLVCITVGFIGYTRLVVGDHGIIESHPDNVFEDLRIDRPFQSLQLHVDSVVLDDLPQNEHSHLPYPIILIKCLQEFYETTGSKQLPTTDELRNLVASKVRRNKDGVPVDEENFGEANKAANTARVPSTRLVEGIRDLLSDPRSKSENLSKDTALFWIYLSALRRFVDGVGNGLLPLRGTCPDMFSSSTQYIALQHIYRDQALHEADLIHEMVEDTLTSLGRSSEETNLERTRRICRNAAFLRIISTPSLAKEETKWPGVLDGKSNVVGEPENEQLIWYMVMRACERFYSERGHLPGYLDADGDAEGLAKCLVHLCDKVWRLGTKVGNQLSHCNQVGEMCRYGGSELHSVAALVGGIAAHEVIKIITSQFIPVNNTFVYNAMTHKSATYTL